VVICQAPAKSDLLTLPMLALLVLTIANIATRPSATNPAKRALRLTFFILPPLFFAQGAAGGQSALPTQTSLHSLKRKTRANWLMAGKKFLAKLCGRSRNQA
jgi:hypothetical protein